VLFRVIDAKFWGVVAMGGAVVILFFLPWLDHSPVRSIRYRPTWHKYLYGIFIVNFLVLGYLGTQAPSPVFNLMSQIGTVIYLAFFLPMAVTRIALTKSGLITDAGSVAALVTLVAVIVPRAFFKKSTSSLSRMLRTSDGRVAVMASPPVNSPALARAMA
jgi:hypothetical protein